MQILHSNAEILHPVCIAMQSAEMPTLTKRSLLGKALALRLILTHQLKQAAAKESISEAGRELGLNYA